MSIGTNQKKVFSNHTVFFSDELRLSSPQFSSCKILYNNQTLYFDIPDQSGTLNNAVNVFPTFYYDNANKLNKVTWEYYSGNTNTIIDGTKILLDVIVQVSATGNAARLYDSKNFEPTIKQDILAIPIDASTIGSINMAYHDIFGNQVVVFYQRK